MTPGQSASGWGGPVPWDLGGTLTGGRLAEMRGLYLGGTGEPWWSGA